MSTMQRIAVIDWGGVANRAWHTIKSQKGWVFPTELEEGRTRIAKLIYSLRASIGWDKAYFAMDRRDENRKYWRHYLLEEWYARSIKQAMCGEHLWVFIDGVWMRPGDDGKPVKLTKKLMKELGDDLREVEATELEESYVKLTPYYKHTRDKRQWAYETDEVIVRKMWGGMADSVAPLVDAKVIRCPGFEADDIAAGFADLEGRSSHIVFITVDSDWQQLLLRPETSLFNLNTGSYVEKEKAVIEAELKEKVICGDIGDCVPPCLDEAGNRITASKLGVLEPTPETKERNIKLVQLLGKQHKQMIIDASKKQIPSDATWESLGISKIEREWLDDNNAIKKLTEMWSEGQFVPTEI